MNEVAIAGTSMIHSYNMLQNMSYGFRVNDKQFIKQWFPVFFGGLDEVAQKAIRKAFKAQTIVLEEGENDGDVIVKY